MDREIFFQRKSKKKDKKKIQEINRNYTIDLVFIIFISLIAITAFALGLESYLVLNPVDGEINFGNRDVVTDGNMFIRGGEVQVGNQTLILKSEGSTNTIRSGDGTQGIALPEKLEFKSMVLDDVPVTASGAELNLLDGSLPGIRGNDTAVIYDSSGTINVYNLTIHSSKIGLGNTDEPREDQANFAVAIGKNTALFNQQEGSIGIGQDAGRGNQKPFAVAVGVQAGTADQGENSVAIGKDAGNDYQGNKSVAIGNGAGKSLQKYDSVAIGTSAGTTEQGFNSIAIGGKAGNYHQGNSSIALGYNAGSSFQGDHSVAIGSQAGVTNQTANSIIINATGTSLNNAPGLSFVVKPVRNTVGTCSLQYNPDTGEITYNTFASAIPEELSIRNMILDGVPITSSGTELNLLDGSLPGIVGFGNAVIYGLAGNIKATNLEISASNIALGFAQQTRSNQGNFSIAIGRNASLTNQGTSSVAIGIGSGGFSQGSNSVGIGSVAASFNQGYECVAIGRQAGFTNQGNESVAIGKDAGNYYQGNSSIALGYNAGVSSQGQNSVAIGRNASFTTQGESSVAIGVGAGQISQGSNSVGIGSIAAFSNQGTCSVAIGRGAGLLYQGDNCIAIGPRAGNSNQADRSIAINATADFLENTVPDSCKINPIRQDDSPPAILGYDNVTKELTHTTSIPYYTKSESNALFESTDRRVKVKLDIYQGTNQAQARITQPANSVLGHVMWVVTKNITATNDIMLEFTDSNLVSFLTSGLQMDSIGSKVPFNNGMLTRTADDPYSTQTNRNQMSSGNVAAITGYDTAPHTRSTPGNGARELMATQTVSYGRSLVYMRRPVGEMSSYTAQDRDLLTTLTVLSGTFSATQLESVVCVVEYVDVS